MTRHKQTSGKNLRWLGPALLGSLYLLSLARPVCAQLPAARLATIFPPGGKVGFQFEVTVTGADLDEATHLVFSASGLAATQKVAAVTGTPEPNKFIVSIATNAPLGVCEARIVGRFGISNPRFFAVGQLPETIESPTNNTAVSAGELPPDTTVNGRATANAFDFYKLSLNKGRRVLVNCLAKDIDSRMEPALVLIDAAGHELERNRRGGVLDFTAPADGQYLLKVADFLYRGGDEFFYRLVVSTGPQIDYVFPPSGLAGTRGKFSLFGRNLPGGAPVKDLTLDGKPLERLEVEIDVPAQPGGFPAALLNQSGAQAVVDGFEYRLRTAEGVSNPQLISFAAGPVIAEVEPNNTPAQAQTISPPCEVVGQFHPGNEQDWFTFEAKKGDVYWVEVFSQRLGLPTDPFVLIHRVTKNDKGVEQIADAQELYDNDTNLGDREFNTTARDPVARFEAKENGTYRVQLRDLFNRTQSNPAHVYRLVLRKPQPDFQLVALTVAPKLKADAKDVAVGVPFVRRGETVGVRVLAFRRDGFDGDIRLTVEDPPAGLRFTETSLRAGKNAETFLLTATEDSPAWNGPLKIIGKAKIGDAEVTHVARGGSLTHQVASFETDRVQSRVTADFSLGVSGVESAPVSIEPVEGKVFEAGATGKLKVSLRVTRRGEFTANLKLKAAGLAALDSLKELEVDGKATNVTFEIDVAQQKLPPGTHVFALTGQATGKYRNNPEAAKAAEDAAKQAEKLSADLAAAAKKAAEDLDKANKATNEAEATAKSAVEKLAAAKDAAGKSPTDEKLGAAKEAAEKAAADATEKSKAAADAKASAEKANTETAAKAKDADAKKQAATGRTKEANERAKPRDVTIALYSVPITVKVTAAETAKAK